MNRISEKTPLGLFVRSLLISSLTLGGGFVVLSVLKRLYVVRLRLLSEEDMLDIAALAQSAPGPVTLNASLLLGYRLAGLRGAVACLFGTILPPLAVMSALAAVRGAFAGNPFVSKVLLGMQAGVAAVILDTALDLTKAASKNEPRVFLPLFIAALFLTLFTPLSAAFVVLLSLAAGVLRILFRYARDKKRARQALGGSAEPGEGGL